MNYVLVVYANRNRHCKFRCGIDGASIPRHRPDLSRTVIDRIECEESTQVEKLAPKRDPGGSGARGSTKIRELETAAEVDNDGQARDDGRIHQDGAEQGRGLIYRKEENCYQAVQSGCQSL